MVCANHLNPADQHIIPDKYSEIPVNLTILSRTECFDAVFVCINKCESGIVDES